MASLLEQLLDLLPATSGGPSMTDRFVPMRQPPVVPRNNDLSPIVHYPAHVGERLDAAMADRPLSENVEDRRLSDKTLLGYLKLIEALDKAGYTQNRGGDIYRQPGFNRRPTAEEMRILRAAGEVKE